MWCAKRTVGVVNLKRLLNPLRRGREFSPRLNPLLTRSCFRDNHVPMKLLTAVFLLIVLESCAKEGPSITQQDLVRNTQELMDAVATGNKSSWQKYFADDCMYFDEKGRSMNKAALLADVSPLPEGYSGTIKLVKAQSHITRDTAILSYDLDETETVFGQKMTARYHGTDTWLLRDGRWQITAGQMLRYYQDPAAGKLNLKTLPDYVGTYQLAPGNVQTIATERGDLYAQRGDRPKAVLIAESPDVFFRKGVEGRLFFRRAENGKVDAIVDRRNNEDIVWRKLQEIKR